MLVADCARCAALCCVALSFDRGPLFGLDKAAGRPCPHLSARARCTIYARRSANGFAGCAAYDCNGAGQRVTQELFQGMSWQDQANLLPDMLDAFRTLRQVHDSLVLLEAAIRLRLSDSERERLEALRARLDPPEGWTGTKLGMLERTSVFVDVAAFLRSLAGTARRTLKVVP